MTGASASRRRYLAGGVVSAVGLLVLGVPAWDVYDDVQNLGWGVPATLVENASFFLLGGMLVVAGGWLVRSNWPTEDVVTVARRTVVGTAAAGVLIGWAVGVQRWTAGGLKPYVLALDGVVVAAVIALGVGLYSAQAERRERELDHQRTLTGYLERLDRYASDLEAVESPEAAVEASLDCVEDLLEPAGARVVLRPEGNGEAGWLPTVSGASERAGREPPLTAARGDADGDPTATTAVGDRGHVAVYGTPIAAHERQVLERLADHLDRTCGRLAREAALRDERESLAFVNRTLRHDLLNDINVVRSRVRLIDDRRQEGNGEGSRDGNAAGGGAVDDHWETVVNRVEDMASFVETMRGYVRTLVRGDHELDAVSLRPVVADAVRTARSRHPEATVDVGSVPAVTVWADDLLGSVFENLLDNAVEHNDGTEPTVRVTAEGRGETIAVTVADDGPGIPETRRAAIFERGEHSETSSGTGFGLHLVADAVDAYGGDVTVRDSDLGGAAFVVELPVAEAADGKRGPDAAEPPDDDAADDGESGTTDTMTQGL